MLYLYLWLQLLVSGLHPSISDISVIYGSLSNCLDNQSAGLLSTFVYHSPSRMVKNHNVLSSSRAIAASGIHGGPPTLLVGFIMFSQYRWETAKFRFLTSHCSQWRLRRPVNIIGEIYHVLPISVVNCKVLSSSRAIAASGVHGGLLTSLDGLAIFSQYLWQIVKFSHPHEPL